MFFFFLQVVFYIFCFSASLALENALSVDLKNAK